MTCEKIARANRAARGLQLRGRFVADLAPNSAGTEPGAAFAGAEPKMRRRPNRQVSDVMSSALITVRQDANVAEVLELSARKGVNHFPIVAGTRAIGLVCTCDLRDATPESNVWQYARHPPVSMSAHSPAQKAARLMREYTVGSVIVNDRNGLCGIVTRGDLAAAGPQLARLIRDSRCSSCDAITHLRPGPDGAQLCVDCEQRARGHNWFDFGAGD